MLTLLLAQALTIPPAPSASAETDLPEAVAVHPAVLVHLASTSRVTLEIKTDDPNEPFTEVCTSPCDTYLPGESLYRIAGPGVRPSGVFALPAQRKATLFAHPRSQLAFAGGIGLTAVGMPALSLGLLWQLAASFGDPPSSASSAPREALVIGGLIATIAGACLTITNVRSRVDGGDSPDLTPASSLAPATRESWSAGIVPVRWQIPVGFSF